MQASPRRELAALPGDGENRRNYVKSVASAAQAAAARPASDGCTDCADYVRAELNSLPDEILDVL